MQFTSLTADQLRTIATLKHAASKDDVTPVITGVQITATELALMVYATDRFRCAEYASHLAADVALPTGSQRTLFDAIVPPAPIDQAVKMLPRRPIGTEATILVQHDEETRTITFSSTVGDPFTAGGSTIVGNYPPLRRLFPADGAALDGSGPLRLNSAFLGALDKITLASLGRSVRFWEMGLQQQEPDTRAKPPAVFTMSGQKDERIRVLIQPSIQR